MKSLFLALLLALAIPAHAQDYSEADLKITDPATIPTPFGLTTSAIYLVVDNPAMTPDELIGAASSWAEQVEFNGTRFENGKPRPYPVNSVTILPAAATVLGPGGAHIKLLHLRRTLQLHDEVPLTLTFARAGVRQVLARVMSGRDFVKLYPLETTFMTLKSIQSEELQKMLPPNLGQ